MNWSGGSGAQSRLARGLLPLLLALSLLVAGCAPETDEEWGLVERVVDGDTFVLSGGERVRLIGIDTPETVKPGTEPEPFGPEASQFAKELLEGKRVRLEWDAERRDRYDRLLAYVYLEDGTFVNQLLVEEGYARTLTVPPNTRYAGQLARAEAEARQERKGLWALEQDRSQPSGGKGLIKGNINSRGEKIYHLPGGQFYDVTIPEVWFETEEEAIRAGFRPSQR